MCPTCKQDYTGPMQLGLVEALWERLNGRPAEDQHRLCVQNNLSTACKGVGRFAEAEALYRYRDILAAAGVWPKPQMTLVSTGNLGGA